jgi:predicted O-methyltransferase YrrM
VFSVRPSHPAGHFYSPVVDVRDLDARQDEIWPPNPHIAGIDFNDASHQHILRNLFPRYLPHYAYPEKAPSADEELTGYYTQNSQFSWLDSRALFVLLQAWRPQRIIEVGSGYSSLLMADINERLLDRSCRITCIEPYPRPFLQRPIAGLSEVIVQKVQEVPLETFESLEAGDILFIDSSHVSKTGSDVNYLYFEVLPRLRDGVRIHIHDIFLPFDYPKEWVLQDQRSWNEQYLLRALLMHSHGFVIEFGCNYAWFRFQDEVSRALAFADGRAFGGGSIWLRRTRS